MLFFMPKGNGIISQIRNVPDTHSKEAWRRFSSLLQAFLPLITIMIILIVTLGFALQAAVTGILQIIMYANPDILSSYNDMINSSFGSAVGFFNIFAVAVLAPIAEELAFRGFGMSISARMFYKPAKTDSKGLKTQPHPIKSYMTCILIISLLFGLYHGNIVQILYAFPMGILLGYLTVLFSTIMPSILLHITINTSAYLLPDILYQTKEMTVFTLIISLIYAAAAIFMIQVLNSST